MFSLTELCPVSLERLLVNWKYISNINVKSLVRLRKGFALEIKKKINEDGGLHPSISASQS